MPATATAATATAAAATGLGTGTVHVTDTSSGSGGSAGSGDGSAGKSEGRVLKSLAIRDSDTTSLVQACELIAPISLTQRRLIRVRRCNAMRCNTVIEMN